MRSRNELASYSARYINSALAAYIVETRRWELADALFGNEGNTASSRVVASPNSAAPAIELCGAAPEVAPKAAPAASKAIARSATSTNIDTPTFIRAFAVVMSGGKGVVGGDGKLVKGAPNFPKLRALQLTGLAQAHARKFPAALASLREAAALEGKTARPPGPPVEKPAHELLGEVLLQAGEARDAIAQFKISLERHPNRALSLLGRARAEVAAGEKSAAHATYAKLLQIWSEADADLPELREAREFVRTKGAVASR
jgi:hypothetical protein